MRGTFFIKPLEITISTKEESFVQGGAIHGELNLKFHGEPQTSEVEVQLCFGEIKKVHQSKVEWEVTSSQKFDLKTKTTLFPFEFPLSINTPISDKKKSPFLVIKMGNESHHLQLNVTPFPLVIKIKELFETFKSFKTKDIKSARGKVEIKFNPPENHSWAHIDSLETSLSFEGETLNWDFNVNLNKLDISGVTNKVKKVSQKFKYSLTPREYYLAKTMPHQDNLLSKIDEVLSLTKARLV